MSKKVQKTLTGAMAAMMATGVVATPAMAATNNTDVDALYKAAYQATQKALTEKTQASVNEARAAIKALPANLDWAIGEFSKQVDTVQHPILVNIVNAIKTAEKTPTQANINAAKKAIPAELTAQWKNSYSSAVDKIQQGLQQKALEAVKKAETEKTQEAIDAAQTLVDDILTADSQALKDWATTLSNRLDAIFTLKVTDFVLNENGTGVTVEFEPTTEILKDVTVIVRDNNGKEIPVQKVDRILAGKSKQVFTFEKVLSDTNFKGVWTVNGVSIDMTELTLVNAVVEASKNSDSKDTTLIALQEAGYINGLLGSYKTAVGSNVKNFVFDEINKVSTEKSYKEAIDKEKAKNTIKTAAQIQAIIDEVNEELGVSADEKDRVALIQKAATSGNSTQFVNALDAENIERVNSDWAVSGKTLGYGYTDYASKISSANSLKDIQEAIDEANLANIEFKLEAIQGKAAWFDADEVVEVSDLANSYLTAEQKLSDNKTLAQKHYNDTVKEQLALIDVKESDNTSTLLRTLKALSEASSNFDYEAYGYDVNIDAYKTKINSVISDKKNGLAVTDIATAVKEVNGDEITKAVKDVVNAFVTPNTTYTTEEKKNINEALDKLVTVTAKETNKVDVTTGKTITVNKFDKAIVSLDLEKYDLVSGATVDELYNSFKTINETESGDTVKVAIEAVKNAKSADELYKALSNELLKVTNLVESNKAEYNRDIDVFKAVDSEENIRKAVTSVNARAEMLKATTVDAMYQGLTKLAISEGNSDVINMSAVERRDVAEEILNYKNSAYDDKKTVDLSTIKAALANEQDKTIKVAQDKVTEKIGAVNNALKFENATVSAISRADLINALHEVTGIDKLTLDGKVETFVSKSTIKDSDGVSINKFEYTNYTQVRNALK